MSQHSLQIHPQSAGAAVAACRARALLTQPGTLALQYALSGDLRRIRIASQGAPERADALWRHTCFEAFVRLGDAPAYLEFNFAPSSRWQAYRFSAYRQDRTPAQLSAAPSITIGHRARAVGSADVAAAEEDALVLEALVALPAADTPPGGLLRVGLSAVVEDDGGALSYWALRHAPGPPDFHHPDTFALRLE